MNYNLSNVQTAPSYDALKRNGFTDIDVIAYYGTENPAHRKAMFTDIKNGILTAKAVEIATRKKGTQKCTDKSNKPDIDQVREMALEYMERDWTYRGQTFNLNKLGWRFAFNDRKRALGLCSHSRRTIYLSDYFIEHNSREMKMWINTMVHEIAHAINSQLGGRGHDWQWRNIFMSFGGDGNRTSCDAEFENLLEKPVSKYTTICPNGHTNPSHKLSRSIRDGRTACRKCCDEHNHGKFDKRFVLKQIQNY